MPLIIGVTGSIATGKSAACEMLVSLGAHHCDADRVVHRLYDPGTDAFDRIVTVFGPEIVGEDGYIDRRALGAMVFGKSEEMSKLTAAFGSIYDAVEQVVEGWRETLGSDDVALSGGGQPDRGRLRTVVRPGLARGMRRGHRASEANGQEPFLTGGGGPAVGEPEAMVGPGAGRRSGPVQQRDDRRVHGPSRCPVPRATQAMERRVA